MHPFIHTFFHILDIAPLSWVGFFLRPVLILAVIVLAAVVLVQTIRERKRERAEAAKTEAQQSSMGCPASEKEQENETDK